MAISKEKEEKLQKRMEKLQIKEEDLLEKFILGSGPGGQKIQKSHSCVYLKHIPTGIEIKCQKDRSREANRYFARSLLCEQVETHIQKEKSKKQQQQEKTRRQKHSGSNGQQ